MVKASPESNYPQKGDVISKRIEQISCMPRRIAHARRNAPDRGEYRQAAGAFAESIAFSEDGASDAEPTYVVPARAGTWDWLHRTRHPLSPCPSIVEALEPAIRATGFITALGAPWIVLRVGPSL